MAEQVVINMKKIFLLLDIHLFIWTEYLLYGVGFLE
jgi:hypothetical protein